MNKSTLTALAVLAILLAQTACQTCENEFATRSDATLAFFRYKTRVATDTAFATVKGIDAPDTLRNVTVENTTLALPLRFNRDTVAYIFTYKSGAADTLKIAYKRETRLISPDCGVYQAYQQLEVIQSTFDSVSVVKPNIDLQNATNIRIYL